MIEILHRFGFLRAILALAAQSLVEIHFIAVKLRAYHAGKAHLASDAHPAGPHIPVPSTINVLRLTVMGMFSFLAVRVANLIIVVVPMATA